jgi:hypothetical protein
MTASLRPLLYLFGALLVGVAWADEPSATGDLERVAGTTSEEKVAYANNAVDEMRDGVKTVSKLLTDAQRDGEGSEEQRTRLQCINNHLTSMKSLLAVSESAATSLQEDLSNGSSELADHELRKIAVALDKSRQLLSEADACNNEDIASGVTTVTVSGAVGEVTDTQAVTYDELEVGAYAPETSPFQ